MADVLFSVPTTHYLAEVLKDVRALNLAARAQLHNPALPSRYIPTRNLYVSFPWSVGNFCDDLIFAIVMGLSTALY